MAEAPDLTPYSFPHLDDTPFPLLENVDVYEYKNEFDYSRWTDSTKIYLCTVLWNNDYSNVVKFADDSARDSYFDNIGGYEVELTSAFNVAPNGTVKVPVPYQVATRYNYLYVDLPIMTSEEEPINYENPRRTKRYYYFINGVTQNSPSSTTLVVSPDNWTTYINNVDIPYLMLERGHAPMQATNVETYLASPISNNRYLLAPDFDFSAGDGVVASSKFVPINNGAKYILFATTMSREQISSQPYPSAVSSINTPATFDNASARNGYQYIVNDYQWGMGGYDYTNFYTQTKTFQSSDDTIPNGMQMIAIPANSASNLFSYMAEHVPYVMKTIKACFMVDDTMFKRGAAFVFCNYTCYFVEPAEDSIVAAVTLSKSDFNFPEKYAGIAKLYTSPYSMLEVTDNNGITKEIKIENTSNLQVMKVTSIAFPFIRIQAYLTGVNGSGYSSYTWKTISGATDTLTIYDDDFSKYLWDWDIPTYALYVRSYDEFKATNYSAQQIARYNAIADYHKTVGMDNTQYENAKDAADTTQTMTNNSANTENSNALAQASTINTNNIASANTAQSNANASADTAQTNTNNQATAMDDNSLRAFARDQNNSATQIRAKRMSVSQANGLNTANQAWDAGLTRDVTSAENAQMVVNGISNAVGELGSGVSGTMSALGSGNILGAIGAGISGGLSIACSGVTTYAAVTKNDTVAEATISNTAAKLTAANNNNNDLMATAITEQTDIVNESTDAAADMVDTTVAMMRTNAQNTNTTEKANATRTNTTSVANANRQQTTSNANANRTQSNAIGNAKLNRDTAVSNANYTRNQGVDNAKITLEQKRIANQQLYYTAQLGAPTEYGTTSGDPTLDAFERRGLQVKVRTQSQGNIAQAGDLMLRYGYSLNQVWDVSESGICLMKHFTYWKASDIWINEGEGVNQDAQSDIQRAFEIGVTVWSNPDEIGKVSIYDNWK